MLRLDVALVARHPVLSRRKAREVIEKGQVMVDGALVREPGTAVGDQASIDWDENRRALPRIRARIPLLYEDDTLLVVDKPAGLLSVPSGPGAEGEDTALLRVREYVVRANPRRPFVGVVHRIDRDTSGLVIFAANPRAQQHLKRQFLRREPERVYWAVLHGRLRPEAGEWRDRLVWNERALIQRKARPADPEALDAVCTYSVLEAFDAATVVEVRLDTGKQNQIRIQAQLHGHPLVGERRYVDEDVSRHGVTFARQALHAFRLSFRHPADDRLLRFEAPLPADLRKLLARLRAESGNQP
jgi:23S rRNA pseudouridine1911/1915/1917 synthase